MSTGLDFIPITENASGIIIEGHVGKWYSVGKSSHKGLTIYELEHETYGDEAAHLIVYADGKILLDDVWNSFNDLELLEG